MFVELTERDYQTQEGIDLNTIEVGVSYSRELAKPIHGSFHPVTYEQFIAMNITMTDNLPPRDKEASGMFIKSLNCISI